jgi:phage shock protein C
MIMAIRGKLYRARKGEVFGVCKGLARWAELPVGPIRLAVILLAVFSGFMPVIIIYVLAAVFLPVEPLYKSKFSDDSKGDFDEDFRNEYRENRKRTVHDLKDEFEKLKRKVAGMEDDVLHDQDKEKDWDSRFNKDS